MASKLMKTKVRFVRPGLTMSDVINKKIEDHNKEQSEDAFFVCDLGDVTQKYRTWNVVFPRIKPFYAVKCNADPVLLNLLALLGTGFDCASQDEIDTIISKGVSPDRIVYANPCKQSNFIRYAATVGVDLMTFDNRDELRKIKKCFPTARLILRILPPQTDKVQCQLGNKYGCEPADAPKLIQLAKDLDLNIVGVSFHVGSGCYDAKVFRRAVEDSRKVFDMGLACGFDMKILDVGGGFPGSPSAKITIHEIAAELNGALDEHFPPSSGVQLISEPGRFFTASAFTLTTNVIAKREIAPDDVGNDSKEHQYMYYINDGVYGSFNSLLYDHAEVQPCVPSICHREEAQYLSSVWGPTCDGLDVINENINLPQLYSGDWLYFRDMGAYTLAAGSLFNGMRRPRIYYIAEVNLSGLSNESIEISAEDQFDLHLESGHSVCEIISPMDIGLITPLCSASL